MRGLTVIDHRCVHCSRNQSGHAEDGRCPLTSVTTFYATMALPAGKTCSDCVHFKRTCSWLLSYKGTETSCDWYPIRFVAIARPNVAPQREEETLP